MTKTMLTKGLGGYALGLFVGGDEKRTNFAHAGQNEGFTCILFGYVEAGQGAVIMTNGDGGSGLFNEILRAVAREYGWPDYRPLEKAVVASNPVPYGSYVGEYEISGIRATISTDGQRLFVIAPPVWPRRLTLYPESGDRFFPLEQDVDLRFVKDAQGHVTAMEAVANGQTMTAKRVN